jgi:molybdopterin molybdotransferase
MALMPVAEALARVLAGTDALPTETVKLDDALGRVLAEDLSALRTQPPAAVSSMDGYAVRASDVGTAPVTLTLTGEVAAGHPFDGAVEAGQAARIFTGGVMPAGADTVVIQELTARDGDTVTIQKATAKGRNVRSYGIDFKQGDVLLRKGRRLSDRDVMLAAGMNHATLPVYRRPKVAVLGTGDELVAPGSQPGPGEIVYSNAAPGPRSTISASRTTASKTSPPPCAARAIGAPIFWSPAAGRPWASTTWCSGHWRPKGWSCRSGGWRCVPAGR